MSDVRVNLRVEGSGSGPQMLRNAADQAARGAATVKNLADNVRALDARPAQQVAQGYQRVSVEADRATQAARQMNAETARTRPGQGAAPAVPRPTPAVGAPPGAAGGPTQQEGGLARGYQETMGKLAVAGAALAVVAKVADGLAKAINVHQDAHLSSVQKLRAMEEGIPVFGDVARARNALADALTGKTKEVQRFQLGQAVTQQQIALGQQQFQATQPLRIQQQQAEARARQLENAPLVQAPRRGDFPETLAGQQAFADSARLTQPRIEQRQAQAEARAARDTLAIQQAQQADQERRVREAADNANRLKAEADRLRQAQPSAASGNLPALSIGAGLGQTGSVRGAGILFGQSVGSLSGAFRGVSPAAGSLADSDSEKDRLKVLGEVDKAVRTEQAERQKLLELTKQAGDAGKQAAEAESNARRANLAVQKEELAILKDREQRIQGNAQAFGQLDEAQKAAAVQAAQRFKTQGYEALTPEERSLVGQAGGGAALNLAAQQNAIRDERFRAFNEAIGQDSDLDAVRQKIGTLESKVTLDVQVDTQKLQAQLADVIKGALDQVTQQYRDLIANVKRDVETQLEIAAANR